MQFDEFRLSLTPDLQTPGQWDVQVTACPTASLIGPKGSASIQVTPQQLGRLRSPMAWPNDAELKQIGTAVWQSIMTAAADAAFKVSLTAAQAQNRSLRLVVSVVGDRPGVTPNGSISPDELPIEALFDHALRFVATDRNLPLSRGVALAADRSPVKIAPPLRVLLVAAAPQDQPPTDAAAESGAIEAALKPLTSNGAVYLETCQPATKEEFRARLQKGFHVVHYIGHGAFRVVANDPTPRAHLCFEDDTALRETDPVDAEQLLVMLRASTVQLVVLTSCVSAAALPAGLPYPTNALGGIAQVLLSSQGGPAAAVAMQFDLEVDAARVFSAAFYQGLLRNDWTLDEAVAGARAALVLRFGAGHRCCINPVVFWRSIGGRLFDWDSFVATGLTDAQRGELMQVDMEEQLLLKMFDDIAASPPSVREAMKPMLVTWQQRIAELGHRRGEILGETLRLHGGTVAADGSVQCRLTLKLRRPVRIGDVRVQLTHDAAAFDTLGETPGPTVPAGALFVQAGAGGARTLLVQQFSAGQPLDPGEHLLATLVYRLNAGNAQAAHRITITNASVQVDGAASAFRGLDAIVFNH